MSEIGTSGNWPLVNADTWPPANADVSYHVQQECESIEEKLDRIIALLERLVKCSK